MTAINLLKDAYEMGIELWTESGKLKYRAPCVLDPELKKALSGSKQEIIEILAKEDQIYIKPTVPGLKTCLICNEYDFIHGYQGGYFCVVCQPNVRSGVLVKAGLERVIR